MTRAAIGSLFTGALAVTATAGQPPAPQEPPTLRTSVAAVTIDAWVHHRHVAIEGLTARDFIVRDNGVERLVNSIGTTDSVHAIVVIDVSGSVTGDAGAALRDAVQRFLSLLTARDRLSLVTFGDRVRVHAVAEAPARVDADDITTLPTVGSTTLLDALLFSSQLARADDRPAMLLLFTDGADTASWTPAGHVIAALRRTSVVVFAVGAGVPNVVPSHAESEYFKTTSWLAATPRDTLGLLRHVTETTGGELLRLDERADVGDAFVSILGRYRQRYLLSFTLPEGVTSGWHRLDVRLRNHRGIVVARQGYMAP